MNTDMSSEVKGFINASYPKTTACNNPTNYDFTVMCPKESPKAKREMVNHPSHYQTKSGLEVIDVIEAFELGFNLGNVVKYVLRCGKKDSDIQELEKAKWYLEREIASRKAQ